MANKQRLRAHEALNVDVSASWDVQDVITCTSSVEGVHSVSPGCDTITIQPIGGNGRYYFTWSTSTATSGVIDTTKDILVYFWYDRINEIRVPRDVGKTPVFHISATVAGTKTIKIVES
jgi:hypothetical protein